MIENILLHDLKSLTAGVPRTFSISDSKIIFNFISKNSDSLIIRFQGALDQMKTPYPFFGYGLSNDLDANIITIADPSLRLSPNLKSCWYIGDFEVNTQAELPIIINDIINLLGIKKIIFVGASSGGFAALYFSYFFPNSLAIVINPQTVVGNIDLNSSKNQYYSTCFPGLNHSEIHAGRITNLSDIYKTTINNYVVYIQNSTAFGDLFQHVFPFMHGIEKNILLNRILLKIDNWGLHGHRGSVPANVHLEWLKLALEAHSFEAEILARTFYRQFEDVKNFILPSSSAANSIESMIFNDYISEKD